MWKNLTRATLSPCHIPTLTWGCREGSQPCRFRGPSHQCQEAVEQRLWVLSAASADDSGVLLTLSTFPHSLLSSGSYLWGAFRIGVSGGKRT